MALRMPTPDDLQRLASENHFELSEEELTSFQEVIPDLFGSYEKLERMPLPRDPIKYRDRDPGVRPSRQEGPFQRHSAPL